MAKTEFEGYDKDTQIEMLVDVANWLEEEVETLIDAVDSQRDALDEFLTAINNADGVPESIKNAAESAYKTLMR